MLQFPASTVRWPKLTAEGMISVFIQNSGVQMGLTLEPQLLVFGELAQIFKCACASVSPLHAIENTIHPYTCCRRVSSACLTLVRLPEPGDQTPDIRSDSWRDLRVVALTRLVTQLQRGCPLKVAQPVAESRLQVFNWQSVDMPVACNVEPCTVHIQWWEKTEERIWGAYGWWDDKSHTGCTTLQRYMVSQKNGSADVWMCSIYSLCEWIQ